jgi:SAM-dependent methyltransferase
LTRTAVRPEVEARARRSQGGSGEAVYRLVARALASRHPGGGTLLDVGCGSGRLWAFLADRFDRYVGVDAARYDGFPPAGEFHAADLDAGALPLPDGCADVVAAVETVEHLENPRAFLRSLARLVSPGGWVVVTTPNQASLLSVATLALHGEHNAFRDGQYPAHLTALLPVDLVRIAGECGLAEASVTFSGRGRIPGSARHWPGALSRAFPRGFSDNVLLAARRPVDAGEAR